MSDLRLQPGHWNSSRVLAERELYRTGFHSIVHLRGSAVQINVLNVLSLNTSLFQGQRNGPRGSSGDSLMRTRWKASQVEPYPAISA